MTIRAGELKHRITLQAPNTTRGGTFADPQDAPTTFATVWARVRPLSGRTLIANRELHPEVTHDVKIRFLAGVEAKMTVVFGLRKFRIDAVRNDDEDDEALLLSCTEVDQGA